MYKENFGNIPNKDKVHFYLIEDNKNMGFWVSYSKLIGKTAKSIAKEIGLDEDIAYAVGSLCKIGKSKGKIGLESVIESFNLLRNEAYFFPAKIAISNSFIIKNIDFYLGEDNIGKRDRKIIRNLLLDYKYNDYDKLIQLLDNLIIEDYVGIDKKQEYLKKKYGNIPFEKERIKILKEYEKYFENKLENPIKFYVDKNMPK